MRWLWLLPACLSLVALASGAARQQGAGWPVASEVLLNEATGTLKRLKGAGLSDFLAQDAAFQAMLKAGDWGPASLYFMAALGPRTCLKDPRQELVVQSVAGDELGFRHARLGQQYRGLPVWGSSLNVHWNAQHAVYLVEGDYIPTPTALNARPRLDEPAALKQAGRILGQSCAGCRPELGIWRGTSAGPKLAYRLRVVQGIDKAITLVMDAGNGDVLEQLSAPR
ncbi:hypothetical protein [Methyloterricola oryzae]|uniref:hypothetical protein n=1 Tax=Methyloterricola oryzae TaxID=1495050 RepID=UPI0009E401EC|nr:hypothetical protein [Methyloterricola oryzae]